MNTRTTAHNSVLVPALLALLAGSALAQNTDRVSVKSGLANVQGNGNCGKAFPSANGDEVAFTSSSSDLVSGDTNSRYDVFVRSRKTNTTVRISVPDPSMNQAQSNGYSALTSVVGAHVMSDNGRYVVFASDADNLVPNDTNGVSDIFVRDRDRDGNGTFDEPGVGFTKTTRVNLSSGEGQAFGPCQDGICPFASWDACISGDGRFVAFVSEADLAAESASYTNVYVRDRDSDNDGIFDESGGSPDAAKTMLVSKRIGSQYNGQQFDGYSDSPCISDNGRYVAFVSLSKFMIFSDSTDTDRDVYVRDIVSNTTTKMSIATDGSHGAVGDSSSPAISGNGRFVAFQSIAHGLVSGDTQWTDIFLRDRDTDADGVLDEAGQVSTTKVSMGRSASPFPQGSVVPLGGHSTAPSISLDGNLIAFQSDATNAQASLVGYDFNNESDILLRDRAAATTRRISVTKLNTESTGKSNAAAISADGRCVSFINNAGDMDGGDNNTAANTDAYVRTLTPNPLNNVCATAWTIPPVNSTVTDSTMGNDLADAFYCTNTAWDSPQGWYKYVAPCDGTVALEISWATFDPMLAVSTGCPGGGSVIVCNDDTNGLLPALTLPTTAGTTYFIHVTGYYFDSGWFRLDVHGCEANPCPADFNQDGGIDGGDIQAFFAAWEAGDAAGDVNFDGGVDGSDVDVFFAAWENGGC